LGLRLSREEHAGRVRFWFDQDRFDQTWFQQRFDRLRDAIGDRYRPALDVDVPVRFLFDGLGRTAEFERRLSELAAEVKRKVRGCRLTTSCERAPAQAPAVQTAVYEVQAVVAPLILSRFSDDGLASIAAVVAGAGQAVSSLVDALYAIRDASSANQDSPSSSPRDRVSWEMQTLGKVASALRELADFLRHAESGLIANSFLLLTGEAGSGKTHLIADVTRARLDLGLPTRRLGDLPDNGDHPARHFLGEVGSSPAWSDLSYEYHGFPGWSKRSGYDAPDLPAPVLATSLDYFAEFNSSDCSLDDTVRITLPTPWLVEQLQLRPGAREGEYLDARGAIAAFDPSVHERGPHALLLRADVLGTLHDAGYDLVWTVRGELRAGTWSDVSDYAHAGARDLAGGWSRGAKGWVGWLDVLPEQEGPVDPGTEGDVGGRRDPFADGLGEPD
jgi:hypothetical protein